MAIYDLTCIKNDVCDKAVCDYQQCKNRADTIDVMKHSLQQLKAEILPLLERAFISVNKHSLDNAIDNIKLAVAKLSAI